MKRFGIPKTLGPNNMRVAIESRLSEKFEKQLFHAALANLEDSKNPIRFNNFAYATRELVRQILSRLAPDDEVFKSPARNEFV